MQGKKDYASRYEGSSQPVAEGVDSSIGVPSSAFAGLAGSGDVVDMHVTSWGQNPFQFASAPAKSGDASEAKYLTLGSTVLSLDFAGPDGMLKLENMEEPFVLMMDASEKSYEDVSIRYAPSSTGNSSQLVNTVGNRSESLKECADLCTKSDTGSNGTNGTNSTNPCIMFQFDGVLCYMKHLDWLVNTTLVNTTGAPLDPTVLTELESGGGVATVTQVYVRRGCASCGAGEVMCLGCPEEVEVESLLLCSYWDTQKENWVVDPKGGVGQYVNGSLRCAFDHLTDFGAFVGKAPVFNPPCFSCWDEFWANPAAIIVVATCLGLLLFSCSCAFKNYYQYSRLSPDEIAASKFALTRITVMSPKTVHETTMKEDVVHRLRHDYICGGICCQLPGLSIQNPLPA